MHLRADDPAQPPARGLAFQWRRHDGRQARGIIEKMREMGW
jgi:hypothetical protein